MYNVFNFSTVDYVPVSFRDGYLYDTYDIITSYLKNKFTDEELSRLLKPVKGNGGAINWYGKYDRSYDRLSSLTPNASEKIKREFHQFLDKSKNIADPLRYSQDPDSKEWGNLIDALFNPQRIVLIGNNFGQWAVLWGWDFKNREENKLPDLPIEKKETTVVNPTIQPKVAPTIPIPTPSTGAIPIPTAAPFATTAAPTNESIQEPEVDDGFNMQPMQEEKVFGKHNVGCFGRIIRMLRWISYRFWGLFWLIIYTLLIIWLCKYCQKQPEDNCKQLEEVEKQLDDLHERVKIKCDTTYRPKI